MPTGHDPEREHAADCAESDECAEPRHHYFHGALPPALIEHATSLRRGPIRRQQRGRAFFLLPAVYITRTLVALFTICSATASPRRQLTPRPAQRVRDGGRRP
jgi:hypothetical protein